MYKRVVKRILDILLGIIALPFVALEFIIVAPLIYLEDKGPICYNAERVGKNGRRFIMYKYRSMYMNAPDLTMEDGSTYNGPHDPRITRIGAFLRKTSLDELPQVINVLKGDMSLIGPRPDLQREVNLYWEGEERKLEVKPGISGYAQVYGRNAIAWHDRIALDIYYVSHLSFILDAQIFFRTFTVVFSQEGIFVDNTDESNAETVNESAEGKSDGSADWKGNRHVNEPTDGKSGRDAEDNTDGSQDHD